MDYSFESDKLKLLVESYGGVISSKALEEAGFNRMNIYNLKLEGILNKESHGYYTLAENQPDEYTIIQKRSDKLIYSHATALFLHGLSDKAPLLLDITVPQGDNISRIKKDYQNTRFHYCKKELWDIGIEKVKTPLGYDVSVYDKERCICDIIKDKEYIDVQIFSMALREYFTDNVCNINKIIKYSKIFNVEGKVRNYMEVLL